MSGTSCQSSRSKKGETGSLVAATKKDETGTRWQSSRSFFLYFHVKISILAEN